MTTYIANTTAQKGIEDLNVLGMMTKHQLGKVIVVRVGIFTNRKA